MEDKKKYEHPKCFLPEKGNPYPLCIGQGKPECEECQLRADWEPEDPYGVHADASPVQGSVHPLGYPLLHSNNLFPL